MCTKKKSLEKNLLKLLESKQIIFSAFKLERSQLPVLGTFSNGKLFAGEKEMRGSAPLSMIIIYLDLGKTEVINLAES